MASAELPRREESTQGHGTLGSPQCLQKGCSGDPKRHAPRERDSCPRTFKFKTRGKLHSCPNRSITRPLTPGGQYQASPGPLMPFGRKVQEKGSGGEFSGVPRCFLGSTPAGWPASPPQNPVRCEGASGHQPLALLIPLGPA